jgi:hypothetical protein
MSLLLKVVAEVIDPVMAPLSSARVTWQNEIRSQDEAQRVVEEPDNGCRRFLVLWIRMVSGDDSLG